MINLITINIIMSDNISMTEAEVDAVVLDLIKLHTFEVVVDEAEFLDLLKNSLSLSMAEKKRVVDAVPVLSQFQFDELGKVFQEERVKFRELAQEHPEDIKKLLVKQQQEWLDLGEVYKLEIAKKAVK